MLAGARLLTVVVLVGGLLWTAVRARWAAPVAMALGGVIAAALVAPARRARRGRRGSGRRNAGLRPGAAHLGMVPDADRPRSVRRRADRGSTVAEPPLAPGRMGRRHRAHAGAHADVGDVVRIGTGRAPRLVRRRRRDRDRRRARHGRPGPSRSPRVWQRSDSPSTTSHRRAWTPADRPRTSR